MNNSVCVGACFSYVVPNTVPSTAGDVTPYCDSCQPANTSWKQVELECTQGQNLRKYVEVIGECNCASCIHPYQEMMEKQQENREMSGIESREESFNATMNLLFPFVNMSNIETLQTLVSQAENNGSSVVHADMKNSDVKILETVLRESSVGNQSSIDLRKFFKLVAEMEPDSLAKNNLAQLRSNFLRTEQLMKNRINSTMPPEAAQELPGPHHSLVLPKDTITVISQEPPVAQVTATHSDDFSSGQKLFPTTVNVSEISYHHNSLLTTDAHNGD